MQRSWLNEGQVRSVNRSDLLAYGQPPSAQKMFDA